METPQKLLWMLVLLVPISLALLGLLWALGIARYDSLADAPRRDVGLTGLDILVAMLLMMVGMALTGELWSRWLAPQIAGEAQAMAARAWVGSLGMQLPMVLYVLVRVHQQRDGLRLFGMIPRRPVRDVIFGLVAFVVAVPWVMTAVTIVTLIAKLLDLHVETLGHDMLQAMAKSDSETATIAMLLAAVVLAPVLEEIIYRGLMQTALASTLPGSRRWLVIVFASVLFAAIHTGPSSWHTLLGLFVLAIMLGWLYEKHASLLPCIVLHAAFNAFNVAMVLMGFVEK